MKKRAQFYLIAAIIIAAVLIGLASITNYAMVKKAPAKFYDLGSELRLESAQVIDHGIYQEKDIPLLIENFTDNYFISYAEEKEKGTELLFVYGNEKNVSVAVASSKQSGEVSISYGEDVFRIMGEESIDVQRIKIPKSETGDIDVSFFGEDYAFILEEGQNFFFIIRNRGDEETYVDTS